MIDEEALARNTFDDIALRDEVLRLFVGQSTELVGRLMAAETAADWKAQAHKLKGSALGVGAVRVAALAAEVEKTAFPAEAAARAAGVALLAEAVRATQEKIARLLT